MSTTGPAPTRCQPMWASAATGSSAVGRGLPREAAAGRRRGGQGGVPRVHQHPQPLAPDHPVRPPVARRADPGGHDRGVRRGLLDGTADPAAESRARGRRPGPGRRGELDQAVGVPPARRAARRLAERRVVHRRGHAARGGRRLQRPPCDARGAGPDARDRRRGDGRRRARHRLGVDLPARQLRRHRRARLAVRGRGRLRRLLRLARPGRGRAVARGAGRVPADRPGGRAARGGVPPQGPGAAELAPDGRRDLAHRARRGPPDSR